MIDMYLYDDDESAQAQFVGFVGEHSRYDLMLVQTNRHLGKQSSLICKQINLALLAQMT